MSGQLRSHRERHEQLRRFYDEGDKVPQCCQSGWEYSVPAEILAAVEKVTGITSDTPNTVYRLCVVSGYSKQQREK